MADGGYHSIHKKYQFIIFKYLNLQRVTKLPQNVNVSLLGVRPVKQTGIDYLGSDSDNMRGQGSLLRALYEQFRRCNPNTLIHTYNSIIRVQISTL